MPLLDRHRLTPELLPAPMRKWLNCCGHSLFDDSHPHAAEEIADIVIVLARLATRLGADVITEVNRKMAINRQREWKITDDGHGYHA
jgi:hypothetical protein